MSAIGGGNVVNTSCKCRVLEVAMLAMGGGKVGNGRWQCWEL